MYGTVKLKFLGLIGFLLCLIAIQHKATVCWAIFVTEIQFKFGLEAVQMVNFLQEIVT